MFRSSFLDYLPSSFLLSHFNPDDELIPSHTAPQILQFRHSLWSGPVATRKHTINKIFPFGAFPFRADSNEVMLYGKVEYGLKNGKEVTVEWAGRAVLVEDEEKNGTWRMGFYQVYLDAGPVVEAMKE